MILDFNANPIDCQCIRQALALWANHRSLLAEAEAVGHATRTLPERSVTYGQSCSGLTQASQQFPEFLTTKLSVTQDLGQ